MEVGDVEDILEDGMVPFAVGLGQDGNVARSGAKDVMVVCKDDCGWRGELCETTKLVSIGAHRAHGSRVQDPLVPNVVPVRNGEQGASCFCGGNCGL